MVTRCPLIDDRRVLSAVTSDGVAGCFCCFFTFFILGTAPLYPSYHYLASIVTLSPRFHEALSVRNKLPIGDFPIL